MASKYTFSVSSDFPNQKVDLERLSESILGSNISADISHITVESGTCDLWFDTSLTGSELSELGTLVSGHAGDEYIFEEEMFAESDGESSTTSAGWLQKIRLSISDLPSGTYEITWYCEYNE